MIIKITNEELHEIRDLYAQGKNQYGNDGRLLFLAYIIQLLKEKEILDEE